MINTENAKILAKELGFNKQKPLCPEPYVTFISEDNIFLDINCITWKSALGYRHGNIFLSSKWEAIETPVILDRLDELRETIAILQKVEKSS